MNLVLIGFMGTGKSKTGKLLALELGYDFIDTDLVIETECHKKIPEIFTDEGEAFFRSLEHKLARELAETDRKVIATGGGWVLKPENLQLSRTNGFVISLTALPEMIFERIKHETHRPLLAGGDPLGKIRQMLAKRESLYRDADLIVDTSLETPEQIMKRIINELTRRGIVNARD